MIELPSELESYRSQLEDSEKDFIKITTEKVEKSSPTESKIGGYPFLPKGFAYPKDKDGTPLEFLAQINFLDVPQNDIYPKNGIIQFFISFDDLYGADLDYETLQEGYRVIYHENIEKEVETNFDFLDSLRENGLSPLSHKNILKMSFQKASEYVSATDYQFENYFGKSIYDFFEKFEEEDEMVEFYYENIDKSGHKLGGYANFTQDDPRAFSETLNKDYELLFQLDSNEDVEDICWGDVGIGNFFIKREDLINRKFSKVIFTWDCG
ncbi:YwqG family protein [Bernardetia sp.]|uniref:YwqG family protein n=1 Tax=Bernardetia sp. TaxID=1937974 RepID=UPI0025C631DF|nr:YwqG family protein [Bernardetia sp.]